MDRLDQMHYESYSSRMPSRRTTATATHGTRDDCESSPECSRLPPPPSSPHHRRYHPLLLVSTYISSSFTPRWCWSIRYIPRSSSTIPFFVHTSSTSSSSSRPSIPVHLLAATDPSSLATSLAHLPWCVQQLWRMGHKRRHCNAPARGSHIGPGPRFPLPSTHSSSSPPRSYSIPSCSSPSQGYQGNTVRRAPHRFDYCVRTHRSRVTCDYRCHFCPGCTVDLRTTLIAHVFFASDDELDFDPDAYLDGDF